MVRTMQLETVGQLFKNEDLSVIWLLIKVYSPVNERHGDRFLVYEFYDHGNRN